MTKPFSPRELIARVKAVLRRLSEKAEKPQVIRIGDLLISKETYSVVKKDTPLTLSSTEFKLLLYLVERKGKIFRPRPAARCCFGKTRHCGTQDRGCAYPAAAYPGRR